MFFPWVYFADNVWDREYRLALVLSKRIWNSPRLGYAVYPLPKLWLSYFLVRDLALSELLVDNLAQIHLMHLIWWSLLRIRCRWRWYNQRSQLNRVESRELDVDCACCLTWGSSVSNELLVALVGMKKHSVQFDVLGLGSRSRCRRYRSSESRHVFLDGRQQWIYLSDSPVVLTRSRSFPNRLEMLMMYHRTDIPKPGHHKDAVLELETQILNSEEFKNQPAECGVLFSLRTRCLRSKSYG